MADKVSYEKKIPNLRLGKAPASAKPEQLHLSNYLKAATPAPKSYNFWYQRTPEPIYDTGNNEAGCCTIASQSLLAGYMEHLELLYTNSRYYPAITKDEILRVYYAMTARLYGGGDTGAYETDALDNWRRPDLTFRSTEGHPLTIDAYTKIDHTNPEEVKKALILGGAHGIKVCFNLPAAWQSASDMKWKLPWKHPLTGDYLPGSWGGHSMMALATYDADGVVLPSSWNMAPGKITWNAFAAYADEAYLVIDSVDDWKKKLTQADHGIDLDLDKLKSDVNSISSQKIN